MIIVALQVKVLKRRLQNLQKNVSQVQIIGVHHQLQNPQRVCGESLLHLSSRSRVCGVLHPRKNQHRFQKTIWGTRRGRRKLPPPPPRASGESHLSGTPKPTGETKCIPSSRLARTAPSRSWMGYWRGPTHGIDLPKQLKKTRRIF